MHLRLPRKCGLPLILNFLRCLCEATLMTIQIVFIDRFTSKTEQFSEAHSFDRRGVALVIEQRLCQPRHSHTNGIVERFDCRISEIIGQTRFKSVQELETTLKHYLATYTTAFSRKPLITSCLSRRSSSCQHGGRNFSARGLMSR